ncbi:MAG: 50S ribosome-binding GTPase [Chromatiales bacterium]|nr:50S ribosome-binding GTPase [Chromatiales bacterium]
MAFAGRSNAGKSSALNLLTGQRRLARGQQNARPHPVVRTSSSGGI